MYYYVWYISLDKEFEKNIEKELDVILETSTPTLEEDNPQNCSTNANETALVEEIQYRSEKENPLTIAPGEGQKPVPISGNKFCVELTHPDLLPT